MMNLNQHRTQDDGFRCQPEQIDAAWQAVQLGIHQGRDAHRSPVWRLAAAAAVLIGIAGFMLFEVQTEPCQTFLCQLEALSDEEVSQLSGLLVEEEGFFSDLDEEW